jgi:hypothetical protein
MSATIEHEHGPAIAAAVQSIAAERAVQDPPTGTAFAGASSSKKATPKQLYRIARETLELLQMDWPESCAAASQLIGELAAANKAKREQARPDGMPF